jgi:hypothetical protein
VTVIINGIWGGRVSQIVDRRVSLRRGNSLPYQALDSDSTKCCVVLCGDALISLAYTGVSVANARWFDIVLTSCLTHKKLGEAFIEPVVPWLARSLHDVIQELELNLNGNLNRDAVSRLQDLQISIVGWHLGRRPTPLAWELRRGPVEGPGMRYFDLSRHRVGQFFRQNPKGLWAETLGDPGLTVDDALQRLTEMNGVTHDDVEVFLKDAIEARAGETVGVGGGCLAIRLNPFDNDGQVQCTYYPSASSQTEVRFLSPWILTPTIACAPAEQATSGHTYSACGKYVEGGFSDMRSRLHVRTRLPTSVVHYGGPVVISYGAQSRLPPP